MARDRTPPSDGELSRVILESAIAAFPTLFRVASCAVLLASAERNTLRAVARRSLTEPQVDALAELLMLGEVAARLASGRPFRPHSADDVSPALQARLREDGWPDLIAVPMPGTGHPTGALVLIPEGEGRWTPARVDAAMEAGVLLATSLRAAIRASEGERVRQRTATLLERLPLVPDRTVTPADALSQVVAGAGAALGVSHCVGVLLDPEPVYAEFCSPEATPIGSPQAPERHPMWRLFPSGGTWSYDEVDASPADRSLTSQLLGGIRPRSVLAVPVRRDGALAGYLLFVHLDRRRRFGDDERRFALIAAGELAGMPALRPAGEESPAPPVPAPGSGSTAPALGRASSPQEAAEAIHAALCRGASDPVDLVMLVRWDKGIRRIHPVAAAGVADGANLVDAPVGEDLISLAIRRDELVTGLGTRALPGSWRSWYRPQRAARALAIPVHADGSRTWVALVVTRDEDALARFLPVMRELGPAIGQAVSRFDLVERASRRERQLTALNELLLATAAVTDLDAACAEASDRIRRSVSDIDLVNVWRLDREGNVLHRVSTQSDVIPHDAIEQQFAMDLDAGVTHAARSRSTEVWHRDQPRLPELLRAFMERADLQTLAAVPMRTAHDIAGTISLGSLNRRMYEPEELTFLETLAGQLGSQLDLVQMRQDAEIERRRLRSLVETLPVGLVVADRRADVRLFSPAAEHILGVPLAGRNLETLVQALHVVNADGRPYPAEELPFIRALQGEASIGEELVLVRPDHSESPLVVNCRPVHDADGTISGAICVFQDLTPLQELSSLKSDFVNTVSHELRTPITTIRGGALTLLKRRQFLDEQTQNELLNDIAEESERLHLLVEDLLSLTRSRSGMGVSPEPILLHRLVNRVIVELGGRVGGHALAIHLSPDLPPVEADPTLLHQVVRNLLENAVKFSPRGQQIEITAEEQEGVIVVSVLDRGSGVPPGDLDRVFEPFYRPDSTVRSGTEGAGLGLAVCRRLVEMQGGRIWAEPREGGGAAFRFTLPLAPGGEEE
jgi:PAS domain S-box-containing protein